jgi:branched-chain amino acid transport system ATP-binding protein
MCFQSFLPTASMLLSLQNISKSFGGLQAVSACSFQVVQGTITALIGPNGAGKTTLFQVISGFLKEDQGTVMLDGVDLTFAPAHERARMGVSRTFQAVRLWKNFTVGDHLFAVLQKKDDRFFDGVFSHDHEHFVGRALEAMKTVGLEKPLKTPVQALSYGEQKLLDLARAILLPHKILLLDEPVAGVNPHLRDHLKHILRTLVQERGETILLIEHDMDFVRSVADRVVVMDQGSVFIEGGVEVLKDPRVLEVYLGEHSL